VRKISGSVDDAPVLFVHGFAGGPSNFRAERDDRPSMLETVGHVRGVATYTFGYSAHSLAWVTDPAIGPALADAITCVAGEHARRVVVVAHSMGGLATQFAQGQAIDGHPVAGRIERIITVGTPFEGAQLLSFASGAGGVIFNEISDAALTACDEEDRQRRARNFCGLLGTTETPAVQAMIPGSASLDALPPWQPDLARYPIAGDIDVTVGVFGLQQVFGVGDLAVSVDSAVAGASRGVVPFVAGCHSSLFDLITAIDDSSCSHTNELANRRVERRVRDLVRDAVRDAQAR
jgi:pimeloyl-ACP methyl ester carboxylesterase